MLNEEERDALMHAHGAWGAWKIKPTEEAKADFLAKIDAFFTIFVRNLEQLDREVASESRILVVKFAEPAKGNEKTLRKLLGDLALGVRPTFPGSEVFGSLKCLFDVVVSDRESAAKAIKILEESPLIDYAHVVQRRDPAGRS